MKVSVFKATSAIYPSPPPFHPSAKYPEYLFSDSSLFSQEPNYVYEGVRENFRLLGFDEKNFGSPGWNPLKDIVRKGTTIVIKPNLVIHDYPHLRFKHCTITHGSVIRAVVDYVLRAVGCEADIVICDVPLQEANFDIIISDNGLKSVVDFYHSCGYTKVRLLDLRKERAVAPDRNSAFITKKVPLAGDPKGYVAIDLKNESELDAITHGNKNSFAVTDYDNVSTESHHTLGHHEYLIAKTILSADTFINVPKLKVHKKTGISICLKNIIGINADKSWLPHYRKGSPRDNGDEYPSQYQVVAGLNATVRRYLQGRNKFLWQAARIPWNWYKCYVMGVRKGSKVSEDSRGFATDGSWPGNDTLWRTTLDLNKIIIFASKDGIMKEVPQRNYFAVVDGIIASEGNGPLRPEPKEAGVILAGSDPVAMDVAAVRLMGFDYRKIPLLDHRMTGTYSCSMFNGNVEHIEIVSNLPWMAKMFMPESKESLAFKPPTMWNKMVEL